MSAPGHAYVGDTSGGCVMVVGQGFGLARRLCGKPPAEHEAPAVKLDTGGYDVAPAPHQAPHQVRTAAPHQMSEPAPEFRMLVTDNDAHHYLIPSRRHDDWAEWLDIEENDDRSWDVPDYARRVEGEPLVFMLAADVEDSMERVRADERRACAALLCPEECGDGSPLTFNKHGVAGHHDVPCRAARLWKARGVTQ